MKDRDLNISDDILSAFLDNELSQADMEDVRDRLAEDPSLTDRLAELATVDDRLQKRYAAIDQEPMPESVTRILEGSSTRQTGATSANVVAFPWWRRLGAHTGKAVAAAVVAGVVLAQWAFLPQNDDGVAPSVARVLESQASGQTYTANAQTSVTPRLTFENQAGDWCRQFRVETSAQATEQIACRSAEAAWSLVAEADVAPTPSPEVYQTASGGSVLDQVLDRIMANGPIGREREQQLMTQQWND